MLKTQMFLIVVLTLLLLVSADVNGEIHGERLRAKRAINPFMDSIGKRAPDSGIFRFSNMKHYLESLGGESSGKHNSIIVLPVYPDE